MRNSSQLSTTRIYLDESGDLGYSAGSSDYFLIAFVSTQAGYRFREYVRTKKIEWGIPRHVELKGGALAPERRLAFLRGLKGLHLSVHYIVVNKQGIEEKLRHDENILFNYVCNLVLVPHVLKLNGRVVVHVDKRTTHVTRGFRLHEYLKYKIFYEAGRTDLELLVDLTESRKNHGIQGADVIANALYRYWHRAGASIENQKQAEASYSVLLQMIRDERTLFFGARK